MVPNIILTDFIVQCINIILTDFIVQCINIILTDFIVQCINIINIIFLFRMTKKSWFGALMGSDREEFHFLTGQDKTLSQIKADIVHAFLSVSIDVKIPRSLRPDW